ncbi:MAG TPA: SDR family NAD(P)-dependent oxidoreductase [Caldilineaceae bacterium]|nr:SDR family NAD(P)-dependent oxidoreductase [Caldilineaceae bacterium]
MPTLVTSMRNPTLSNRVAIVTGASSGIGRATAIALAQAGARVVLAARREEALREAGQEIRAFGGEALLIPTDVTHQEEAARLVQTALATWGRVDILIANAGQYVRGRVAALEVADIERSMAVNFYGALYAILAVLPSMLAQRSGHLVLVSSMDAKKGLPSDAPYVAAKSALSGFGEVLRQELYGSGVALTIIFPGRVATPMISHLKVPWISAPIPADAVAQSIVRAIQRGQPEVIIPPLARALVLINTLSPRAGDWLVRLFHLEGWELDSATRR